MLRKSPMNSTHNLREGFRTRALEKEAVEYQEKDLELWREWRRTRSHAVLEQLYDRLEPTISYHLQRWRSARVPQGALRAEAERLTLEALNTYDPNSGAAIRTYVNQWLQKLYSYVVNAGSVTKIPEHRYRQFRKFTSAERELKDKFKRDPSAAELADHLKIPKSEVERYRKESYGVLTETPESDVLSDFMGHSPQNRYILEAAYYDLSPDEKVVYEFLSGRYGRPQVTSTSEIARLANMSASKVYRLKNSIGQKMKAFQEML